MFGICNLAIIPLRAEPSDRSEIVSQVLFGEHFKVLEELNQWRRIQLHYDNYEGWVDSKQFQMISEAAYNTLSKEPIILNADLIDYISAPNNTLLPIPIGASLSFLNHDDINTAQFEFDGTKTSGVQDKSKLIATAFMYLNAPYLWGGKTPFGIDCSGFTAWDLCMTMMQHGLLAKPTHGDKIRFAPPLCITKAQIDEALAIIKKSLACLEN